MRLRARPSLFRALGRREPPEVVTISGRTYRQVEVLKHDSWAATARYADDDGHQVACKFGRRQPLLFLPAAWLGRRLARKEADLLRFLSDVDGLPAWSGPVYVDGRELDTVVAHDWLPGKPFYHEADVDETFFPRLKAIIDAIHDHDVAFVDLGKVENILIGDDGRPLLLDFQIAFRLRPGRPLRWWLRELQRVDTYHVYKHWRDTRPEDLTPEERDLTRLRPCVTRIAHRIQSTLRGFRRRILICLHVRDKSGRASSELAPEVAVRQRLEREQET